MGCGEIQYIGYVHTAYDVYRVTTYTLQYVSLYRVCIRYRNEKDLSRSEAIRRREANYNYYTSYRFGGRQGRVVRTQPGRCCRYHNK